MGKDFSSALRPAIVMTILFAGLLGIAYPLAMTGVGQAIFPDQSNGSLVRDARGTEHHLPLGAVTQARLAFNWNSRKE